MSVHPLIEQDAFSYRRLQSQDTALFQQLIRSFRKTPAPPDERIKELLERNSHIYLAAFASELPVGWAVGYVIERFEAPELYLYEIDVLADWRRQGVGTRLVEVMKHYAQALGAQNMFVFTDSDNQPAQGLYHTTGGVARPKNQRMYGYRIQAQT